MLAAVIVTAIFTIPIALLWVNVLDKYYKSGQYEQDLKDGVYEDKENFP